MQLMAVGLVSYRVCLRPAQTGRGHLGVGARAWRSRMRAEKTLGRCVFVGKSQKRPHMPLEQRAKIFVPFDPLDGFRQALREKEREVEEAALDERGGLDPEAPDLGPRPRRNR